MSSVKTIRKNRKDLWAEVCTFSPWDVVSLYHIAQVISSESSDRTLIHMISISSCCFVDIFCKVDMKMLSCSWIPNCTDIVMCSGECYRECPATKIETCYEIPRPFREFRVLVASYGLDNGQGKEKSINFSSPCSVPLTLDKLLVSLSGCLA